MKKALSTLLLPVWLLLRVVAFIIPVAGAEETLHVTVSIPPQAYFVKRIGGEHVTVTVMVPSGSDPHIFEPKPQQLVNLAGSSIYFAIGVTFEDAWLDRFRSVNPDMRIVFTDKDIEKSPMTGDSHSGEKTTHAGTPDPHIWLSPPLAMIQARTIYTTLADIDPIHREDYSIRYKTLIGEMADLDCELSAYFSGQKGQNTFIVFHPSWGYFARAYGLEQVPIEIEGKEPKPADLARLITFARQHNIRAIFVQPQFSAKSARTIADAIQGQVIMADPLAENWMENLKNVADKLKPALR